MLAFEIINLKSCDMWIRFLLFFFVCQQGVRLHYVEAGDRNKPLILFVHGFPEFWYSWRHQITEFSKDYWYVLALKCFAFLRRSTVLDIQFDVQVFIISIFVFLAI